MQKPAHSCNYGAMIINPKQYILNILKNV